MAGAILTLFLVLLLVSQAAMVFGSIVHDANFAIGGVVATVVIFALCMFAINRIGKHNGMQEVQAQAARMGYGKIAPVQEGCASEFRWIHGRQGRSDE